MKAACPKTDACLHSETVFSLYLTFGDTTQYRLPSDAAIDFNLSR
jgi:hypothetical protein